MLAGEGWGGGCHEPHLSPPEPRTTGGRNMRFGDCFAGLLGKKNKIRILFCAVQMLFGKYCGSEV